MIPHPTNSHPAHLKRISPALFGLLFFAGCATSPPPPATVPQVDPARYAGTWHEVARLPNWFQKPTDRDTTATYRLLPDGKIEVINSTTKQAGQRRDIRGTATPVPGSHNAKLKVRFFGPFAGDYWIIGLDPIDYQWAVVGHPSRKYLWFLSRSPTPATADLQKMRAAALAAGYSPASLTQLITPPDYPASSD
jgi:apolipoprotein D and lipocalin family protein